MRHYFANTRLIIFISVLYVAAFALLSYYSCKWHWFGRAGAIVTMAGVLLSVRALIRMGFAEWIKSQFKNGGAKLSGSLVDTEKNDQQELDSEATRAGVILMIIGTLIWAYGDLLGGLP